VHLLHLCNYSGVFKLPLGPCINYITLGGDVIKVGRGGVQIIVTLYDIRRWFDVHVTLRLKKTSGRFVFLLP